MKYVKKNLSDIHPYKNNPRNIETAVDDVAESIRQCGYISPIVIDEKGTILAGHTRYKALLKTGFTECNVIQVSDLTSDQKKKFRLYDNKAAELSSWDNKLLKEALSNIDFEGYDFGQPSFEKKSSDSESDGFVTCPCCGEVFKA